jgi:hypothetical protein
MYVGLWSRMRSFRRADLDRALRRRTVVQATLMRSTIHLVSARDWWPLVLAIREHRRQHWLRTRKGYEARQMSAIAARLRRRLAGGELQRAEVEAIAGDRVALGGLGHWLELVRVPPSGTWEHRRADIYAAAEDWLGAPPSLGRVEAVVHLVRAYLRGFGPAPLRDIAGWAGVPPTAIEPALERMRLRRFASTAGEELVDLPGAALPPAGAEAPPRFLPVWDATLLAHARRTGILPEEHRSKVFNARTPQSVSTFIVGGAVAGTWRQEHGRIEIEPFERLSRGAERALRAEAGRLAELYG